MKYAIMESGGKQYIAREGETIEVDRLPLENGRSVDFKSVLLIVDDKKIQVGTPLIRGAQVKGKVVEEIKAPKVIVFKYIPRERYRRKQGHRQRYTRVLVNKIQVAKPRKKAEEPKAAEKVEKAKPTAESKAPKAKATPKKKAAESKPAAKKKTTESKPTAKKKTTTSKSASKSTAKPSKSSDKAKPKK